MNLHRCVQTNLPELDVEVVLFLKFLFNEFRQAIEGRKPYGSVYYMFKQLEASMFPICFSLGKHEVYHDRTLCMRYIEYPMASLLIVISYACLSQN